MKRILLILICFQGILLYSQDLSYSKPGRDYYTELPDPVRTDPAEWSKVNDRMNVSFASDNVRYPREKVPQVSQKDTWVVSGWKGEKVHTQILVWTKEQIPYLTFRLNDLTNGKKAKIGKGNLDAAFVRYVMSDGFFEGCSQEKKNVHDSSLVADPLDIINRIPVSANTVQPVWLTVRIPQDIPAGNYNGSLVIEGSGEHLLKIRLKVLDHVLPSPDKWKYDFDLWQYPAPIARIHNVKLWSDEHFDLMRLYFSRLASSGQKVITANIIEQPWGLDHVHFDDPTLIKWIKKPDGSWVYDYTIFDKFINLMMSCGIKQRINCYSMITWDLSFIYYDEASGSNATIKLKPGTQEYTDFWKPMIKDFTAHLKSMGWFGITSIAFDERPVESLREVIKLLRDVDPEWKLALATDTYHPEIESDIFDYSLASYLKIDKEILADRKAQCKPTTFYTACPENHPNGYSFSPPAENAWLGWYAAAKGYTGYLWWAFNTWVENPLLDSRWKRYPAGSLFQFYPGPRSSIRFEKLIEGIQAFEKVNILKEQFSAEDNAGLLKKIDELLLLFDLKRLDNEAAAITVEKANKVINQF